MFNSKKIFSSIRELWKNAIAKVVICVGFVAGLGAFLGNIGDIQSFFTKLFDAKKGLQLVEASVTDSIVYPNNSAVLPLSAFSGNTEQFVDIDSLNTKSLIHEDSINKMMEDAVLKRSSNKSTKRLPRLISKQRNAIDIKLRNNGNEIAFIKKVEILVKKRWIFFCEEENVDYFVAPTTASYAFTLTSRREPPYVISVNVSHTIKPSEADRFELLSDCTMDGNRTFVYLVDILIIYNEDNSTVAKKNLFLTFQPYHNKDIYKRDPKNLKSMQEIKSTLGERTETLDSILQQFN